MAARAPSAVAGPSGLVIRPARVAELETLVAILLAARQSAMPGLALPRAGEVAAWLEGAITYLDDVEEDEDLTDGGMFGIWRCLVAEHEGQAIGFIEFDDAPLCDSSITQLYVRPDWQRCGVGGRLVDRVLASEPLAVDAWVFAGNAMGRAFWRGRGFERVPGVVSRNQQGEAAVLYRWPSADAPSFSYTFLTNTMGVTKAPDDGEEIEP